MQSDRMWNECFAIHYSDDLQLTGATAVFMFDPATISVNESDPSAQVCVELSGLVGGESLGCEVTITLNILEGHLASMLINNTCPCTHGLYKCRFVASSSASYRNMNTIFDIMIVTHLILCHFLSFYALSLRQLQIYTTVISDLHLLCIFASRNHMYMYELWCICNYILYMCVVFASHTL